MLRLMTFVLGFSVLAAASPGADAQTPPPSFVFVQGIVGSDIGTSYLPGLPVDVAVGSTCVRAAVSFGSGIGPFPLSVGDYTITISLANTLAPCTNSAFLTATGSVTAGQQIAVVAAESASGPEIQVYPLTPPQGGIPTGSAVLDFISAGNFPTLNLTLMNKAKGIDITIPALAPDAPPTQEVVPSFTTITTTALQGSTVVAGPINIAPQNRNLVGVFIVGSFTENTGTLVRVALPGQF